GAAGGDSSRLLMSYHPNSQHTSAEWFHGDAWFDFSMLQSGHGARNRPNYRWLTADYRRVPAKPTLDAEPNYEHGRVGGEGGRERFTDYDVRKSAYRSVLA